MRSLDRDSQPQWDVNVLANDEPDSPTNRIGYAIISVFPKDINDNYPVFIEETLTASVEENRTTSKCLSGGVQLVIHLCLLVHLFSSIVFLAVRLVSLGLLIGIAGILHCAIVCSCVGAEAMCVRGACHFCYCSPYILSSVCCKHL